ncbi:hypothetical protein EV127DRAFT_447654 [Xylaria flabelliformis]|nr:hypothetical protein EV127DRAFT_447654 [Xylaria flabelliformis]
MHFSSIVWPFVPLTFAFPLEPRGAPEFVITNLGATFPYPIPPYGLPSVNSFIDISVTYPDPTSSTGNNLNTTCSAVWPEGTDPAPVDWTACASSSLQFRLPADGWTSTTNFTVELWETLASSGSGLDASQLLTSDIGNPSDPNAYLFCIEKGKFNPLTCTLTGPQGQMQRTVLLPVVELSSRPA